MIIIVGAGLAGLTCAKVLAHAGREVLVLEASDGVGGRVRTDIQADYRLDRGFQVLFTAYPTVQRHLDLAALRLQAFQPGALIAQRGKLYAVSDPFRDHNFSRVAATVTNPLMSVGDKLRMVALRNATRQQTITATLHAPQADDRSTLAELQALGFTTKGSIDQFFRPFYGGIFLNRDLHTSARMFRFIFKMLATGDIALPAQGIGAITEQLVSHLPVGAVRTRSRVDEVVVQGGKVAGVRLSTGEHIAAETVVLAVEAPAAQRLAGIEIPAAAQPVAANCAYFAAPTSLYEGPKLVLNADPAGFINNVTQLTNIAPSYAPAGQHLISAVILGQPALDDAAIEARCRRDLAQLFPQADVTTLRWLGMYRIPMAQFDQPPGIFQQLPDNGTTTAGLLVAGEFTESSSIHGAMLSGEKAAQAILG